jgi:hypothetical protein
VDVGKQFGRSVDLGKTNRSLKKYQELSQYFYLLQNKFKYFEAFLFHEIEDFKGNAYMELLWKYYEKNQNYLEAAKVLAEMASKATRYILNSLQKRKSTLIFLKPCGYQPANPVPFKCPDVHPIGARDKDEHRIEARYPG